MLKLRNTGCRQEAAQAYFGSSWVVDIIYFDLRVQTPRVFQQPSALIGRDGITAATKAHQLNELSIRMVAYIAGGGV